MCTLPNEVPVDYFAGLDQAGRRLDEAQRPELSHGTVDYVAPREYMVSRVLHPAGILEPLICSVDSCLIGHAIFGANLANTWHDAVLSWRNKRS